MRNVQRGQPAQRPRRQPSPRPRPCVRRGEIVRALAARLKTSERFADELVGSLFDLLAELLENGTAIDVRGFGRFDVKVWRARRNPLLGGGSKLLPERGYVRFRTAGVLKARVRKGR